MVGQERTPDFPVFDPEKVPTQCKRVVQTDEGILNVHQEIRKVVGKVITECNRDDGKNQTLI